MSEIAQLAASLPQHVVKAARLVADHADCIADEDALRHIIAAALFELMDDAPVEVVLLHDRGNRITIGFPPSAMLAAVLARAKGER